MPALAVAQALGERAATVGFDWETVRGVFDKVGEELDELRRADTPAERAEELGDVLFVLARVGSWLDVDVEDALRRANRKFRVRFGRWRWPLGGREWNWHRSRTPSGTVCGTRPSGPPEW